MEERQQRVEQHQPQFKPEKVSKFVYDGLEYIRQAGGTDMQDRGMVYSQARDWHLTDTAEWLEGISSYLFEELMRRNLIVLNEDDASVDRKVVLVENDDAERMKNDVICELGQRAALAIATSYGSEAMGALAASPNRITVPRDRLALMQNLAEVSTLWRQLEETVSDIEEDIKSLQSMIDPESY